MHGNDAKTTTTMGLPEKKTKHLMGSNRFGHVGILLDPIIYKNNFPFMHISGETKYLFM